MGMGTSSHAPARGRLRVLTADVGSRGDRGGAGLVQRRRGCLAAAEPADVRGDLRTKADRWLEYTVVGLLVTNGSCQIIAARCGETDTARRLGGGTALTLLAIDVVFVPAGRIRWTYLIDAALEAGWLGLWAGTRRR
jgi:hypothetical protein